MGGGEAGKGDSQGRNIETLGEFKSKSAFFFFFVIQSMRWNASEGHSIPNSSNRFHIPFPCQTAFFFLSDLRIEFFRKRRLLNALWMRNRKMREVFE
jgi:hypothetical protein